MDEGEEPIRPKEDNSGFDVPTEKGKPPLDKASIKDSINRLTIYKTIVWSIIRVEILFYCVLKDPKA